MMIQELIVMVVGVGVAVILLCKIYYFFVKKDTDTKSYGCDNCHYNISRKK